MVDFFQSIGKGISVPLVVFQYSDSTGSSYPVSVLGELAALPEVQAVKLGAESLAEYVRGTNAIAGRAATLAACDRADLFAMMVAGCNGVMAGITAIRPQRWAHILQEIGNGAIQTAWTQFKTLCIPLMEALFTTEKSRPAEIEVAAVKHALVHLGQLDNGAVRLPGAGIDDRRMQQVVEAVSKMECADHGD